tara:strand:+ start:752 stop:970 length:219 start_codon:yes stop_codon:yes gene_type:complete
MFPIYRSILILLIIALAKRLITSLVLDLQEFLSDARMKRITKYKHEIMWWMSRLTVMGVSLSLAVRLAAEAY